MTQAIIHASEILTGEGVVAKDGRRLDAQDMGRIEDGAMVFDKGKIIWVGKTINLQRRYIKAKTKNLKHAKAIVPGFVDCHTHLVFAGNRADEFARRCAGESYESIAASGGGIVATVRATRAANAAELEKLAISRVGEARAWGVRVLEIKSGYGLDLETEIKILRVIQRLKKRFKDMTIEATFMGAHAFPPDASREEYVKMICEVMIPEVSRKKLASACDVFVDRGYFSIEEAKNILAAARSHGLKIKIHADELSDTGATALAVKAGALSADHLLKISESGIRALASSDTTAVILPGTALYLKTANAPVRALLDAGARVALATDFNPGSCMCNSLPVIMTLAALNLGMTTAEIFGAVTYNGAKALGLERNKGALLPGKDATFLELPFKTFEDVFYQLGWAPK